KTTSSASSPRARPTPAAASCPARTPRCPGRRWTGRTPSASPRSGNARVPGLRSIPPGALFRHPTKGFWNKPRQGCKNKAPDGGYSRNPGGEDSARNKKSNHPTATPHQGPVMFGTFVIEQDPLAYKDVPAQMMTWVQSVGGVAAVGVIIWSVL